MGNTVDAQQDGPPVSDEFDGTDIGPAIVTVRTPDKPRTSAVERLKYAVCLGENWVHTDYEDGHGEFIPINRVKNIQSKSRSRIEELKNAQGGGGFK